MSTTTFHSCQEIGLLFSMSIIRNLVFRVQPLCYIRFRCNNELILTWENTEIRSTSFEVKLSGFKSNLHYWLFCNFGYITQNHKELCHPYQKEHNNHHHVEWLVWLNQLINTARCLAHWLAHTKNTNSVIQ